MMIEIAARGSASEDAVAGAAQRASEKAAARVIELSRHNAMSTKPTEIIDHLDCIASLLIQMGLIEKDGEVDPFPVSAVEDAIAKLRACGWIVERTTGIGWFKSRRLYFDFERQQADLQVAGLVGNTDAS